MKFSFRSAVLSLACLALASAPASAVVGPAPQAQSACFSILSLPCIDCPSQRSKYCIPDPAGPFQHCSATSSSCDATHHCSEVLVDTGPACGN